jgi:hypothetical protein
LLYETNSKKTAVHFRLETTGCSGSQTLRLGNISVGEDDLVGSAYDVNGNIMDQQFLNRNIFYQLAVMHCKSFEE